MLPSISIDFFYINWLIWYNSPLRLWCMKPLIFSSKYLTPSHCRSCLYWWQLAAPPPGPRALCSVSATISITPPPPLPRAQPRCPYWGMWTTRTSTGPTPTVTRYVCCCYIMCLYKPTMCCQSVIEPNVMISMPFVHICIRHLAPPAAANARIFGHSTQTHIGSKLICLRLWFW